MPNSLLATTEQITKDVALHLAQKAQLNVNPELAKDVLTVLSTNPPQTELKINKMANDSVYLPISYVENLLDELYFGLWNTKNFQIQIVANEIVGWLDLEVYNAPSQSWITRTGCASVQIQMDSGLKDENGNQVWQDKKKVKDPNFRISDIDRKITNTLVKDFPHLKSECLKNACRSLGKAFGRDLNRKFEDEYNPNESMENRIDNNRTITQAEIDIIDQILSYLQVTAKQKIFLCQTLGVQSINTIKPDNLINIVPLFDKIAVKNNIEITESQKNMINDLAGGLYAN